MLNTKEEIEKWLIESNIKNYTIREDLTVDVDGDVNLFRYCFEEIPIQFGEVNGDFDCSNNNLITLKGSPIKINGNFDCSYNTLVNLKYSPQEISGDFDCSYNLIENLEGAPLEIYGDFNFYCNEVESLKYSPKKVGGDFIASNNRLKNIEGVPREVGKSLSIESNNINIDTLKFFDCYVGEEISSDFGYKENFLILVGQKKAYFEKENLELFIKTEENKMSLKKRM